MEHDIIDCTNNPTAKEVDKHMSALSKEMRKGKTASPVENYLVIFLFAGHGVLRDGMQAMLYNEFDNRCNFYKFLMAEKKLRGWAEIYPNSYIIGIYACCRQLYNPQAMSGCIEKHTALEYIEKQKQLKPLHTETFRRAELDFIQAQAAWEKA